MYDKLIAAIHQAKAAGLAPGNAQKDLGIDDRSWRQLSRLAIDEGHASALGSHLIDRQVLEDIRTATRNLLAAQGSFDLAAFRAASGLSRNLAVTVLEMFDASGLTRRDGDRRIPG
jgi:selenocysteine-specific elongation factor